MLTRTWLLAFILSFLAALTFPPAFADSGWVQQTSPVNTNLNGVDFVDPDHGWICGNTGTILHTTNGGQAWVQQDLGSLWDVTDIDFVDLAHGYAVGALSTIWRTTDGGATWTAIHHSEQTPAKTSVFVIDPNTVWVTGYDESPGGPTASIAVTTDAGATWEWGTIFMDHGTKAADIVAFSAQTALVSCDLRRYDNSWYSGLYKTTDACASFQDVTSMSAPQQEVQFLSPRIGFYGPRWEGPGGDLKETTDGGATWSSRHLDGDVLPTHMSFMSASLGWVAGGYGYGFAYIARTTDAGSTWVQQETGTAGGLNRIQFITASIGTAVGGNGTILHTITGGMSGADVVTDSRSGGPHLLLPEPNPSNGPVRLAYVAPGEGPVRIRIINVDGRAIRELEALPGGSGLQEVAWDGRDALGHPAAPGAYFIRLISSGGTKAQRITLVR